MTVRLTRSYYSTSPSIYLELVGTAGVKDQCTTVGPRLINPILTLPPGALTTWRPPPFGVEDDDTLKFFVGDVWSKEDFFELITNNVQYTASLDVKDLACPTWGLGRSTAANGTIITTVGPPWLPLIQPPMEIFTLHPTWRALCTGIHKDLMMTSLDLFDPPSALTLAPLLLPTSLLRSTPKPTPTPADPTTRPEQVSTSAEAAKPASMLNRSSATPTETGNPRKGHLVKSPAVASAGPVGSAFLPDGPVDSPNDKGDPPTDSPADPKLISAPVDSGHPPVRSSIPSNPNLSSYDLQQSLSDLKVPIVPVQLSGEISQTQTQGLGATTYDALMKSGPEIDRSSITLLTPQLILSIGAQTLTANPSGLKVSSAAISPSDIHAVNDTQTSLDQNGGLEVDSSTTSLPTPSDPSPSKAYIDACETFTPEPSAFRIDGTVVSAGGPAATVNKTAISLGRDGALQIGSSTIALLPSHVSSYNVTIDGFDINVHSSSTVADDDVTLSAAAAGVTIPGESVRLEAGAQTVNIETRPFAVPAATGGSDVSVQAFVGGQGKGAEGSFVLVCGIVVGVVMMMVVL